MKTSLPDIARADLRAAVLPLRIAFVAIPLLAGLDKFVGLLADWSVYVGPFVRDHLPIGVGAFLAVVGLIEIAVGVLMATRYVRAAATVACAWLVLIALQLALAGWLDVAVRDLAMAVAAYTLARLSPSPALRSTGRGAEVPA